MHIIIQLQLMEDLPEMPFIKCMNYCLTGTV